MAKIRNRDAVGRIAAREAFESHTGNFRGVPWEVGYLGSLPGAWRRAYEATQASITYTVMSYRTPIAWYAEGRWVIPDVKYSQTTTRHQNLVREAISVWQTSPSRETARRHASRTRTRAAVARRSEEPEGDLMTRIHHALADVEAVSQSVVRHEQYRDDDFEPDNGAGVFTSRSQVTSGEGAIYSSEYLAKKYGRNEA